MLCYATLSYAVAKRSEAWQRMAELGKAMHNLAWSCLTMLSYAMLSYAMLSYAMLSCAMQGHA